MRGILVIRGSDLRMGWKEQAETLCGRPGFRDGAKTACDALADSASVEGTEAHEQIAWPVYLHMINLTDSWAGITIDELRKTCIYE